MRAPLTCFLLCLFACCASAQVKYRIPLLSADRPVVEPAGTWTYTFDIPPAVRMLGGSLELMYAYPSTLLPGKGSVTVALNDQPIATKEMPYNEAQPARIRVDLPRGLMHQGANELTVYTRQHSVEVPCGDIDNKANWVKFLRGSVLSLTRSDRAPFPLMSYPFPYLDSLSPSPVRSTWVMANVPKPHEIAAALDLASDWGRRMPRAYLRFNVVKGVAPESGIAVSIGAPPAGKKDFLQAVERNGASALHLRSQSEKGFRGMLNALADPELTKPAAGFTMPPSSKEPLPSAPPSGEFRLSDLGVKQPITLKGAFRRETEFDFLRPPLKGVEKMTVQIRFGHSAALQAKSQLALLLNGVPIASVALNAGNEKGGVLEAEIPERLQNANRFRFELVAQHDLGAIDCTKDYNKVAWTVIEPESSIKLEGRQDGAPYLDNFPVVIEGLARMDLPLNPTAAELSLAATIAGNAGQHNLAPIRWSVGGESESGTQVALGSYADEDRIRQTGLYVSPSADGKPNIRAGIDLQPATLADAVVLQAIGNENSVRYVVLAANERALRRFTNFLASPKSTSVYIGGPLCVFTREGKLIQVPVSGSATAPGLAQVSLPAQTRWLIVGGILLAFGLVYSLLRFSSRT